MLLVCSSRENRIDETIHKSDTIKFEKIIDLSGHNLSFESGADPEIFEGRCG
jgi:hypothetical protein